jgi:hypothetical protein
MVSELSVYGWLDPLLWAWGEAKHHGDWSLWQRLLTSWWPGSREERMTAWRASSFSLLHLGPHLIGWHCPHSGQATTPQFLSHVPIFSENALTDMTRCALPFSQAFLNPIVLAIKINHHILHRKMRRYHQSKGKQRIDTLPKKWKTPALGL